MPIVKINPHYEDLQDIPCQSYIELEDGRRVLLLDFVEVDNIWSPDARIKDENGVTRNIPIAQQARYICSIVDYEALSVV